MRWNIALAFFLGRGLAAPLSQKGADENRSTLLKPRILFNTFNEINQANRSAANPQNVNLHGYGRASDGVNGIKFQPRAFSTDNGRAGGGTNDKNASDNDRAGEAYNGLSSQAMIKAAQKWRKDTGVVSDFLNAGPAISNDPQFKQAALLAFNAEVDELDQKNVLDKAFAANKRARMAGKVLENGSFQFVVDSLKTLTESGKKSEWLIEEINQIRCPVILPSIDTYFRIATDATLVDLNTAIRPAACKFQEPKDLGDLIEGHQRDSNLQFIDVEDIKKNSKGRQ